VVVFDPQRSMMPRCSRLTVRYGSYAGSRGGALLRAAVRVPRAAVRMARAAVRIVPSCPNLTLRQSCSTPVEFSCSRGRTSCSQWALRNLTAPAVCAGIIHFHRIHQPFGIVSRLQSVTEAAKVESLQSL